MPPKLTTSTKWADGNRGRYDKALVKRNASNEAVMLVGLVDDEGTQIGIDGVPLEARTLNLVEVLDSILDEQRTTNVLLRELLGFEGEL